MKILVAAIAVLMFGITQASTEKKIEKETKKSEISVDGQQVRFYNECSSSVDFYVKGSGGTTRYTVSGKSSKNVSVNPGDKILDSSRNEIVEISSSTTKVIVCE